MYLSFVIDMAGRSHWLTPRRLVMLWLTVPAKFKLVLPPPLAPVFVKIRFPIKLMVPPFRVILLLGNAAVPVMLISPEAVSVVPARLTI